MGGIKESTWIGSGNNAQVMYISRTNCIVGSIYFQKAPSAEKEISMVNETSSVIIKFDFSTEQTVGEITKIVGLAQAKYLIPIIDYLNLEANPRSSKTGSVTDAIQESIENSPSLFPFKTKGILLASSQYERLERNRVRISPKNPGNQPRISFEAPCNADAMSTAITEPDNTLP